MASQIALKLRPCDSFSDTPSALMKSMTMPSIRRIASPYSWSRFSSPSLAKTRFMISR